MGEIPERKTFREPVLRKALVPYLEIVKGEFYMCMGVTRLFYEGRGLTLTCPFFIFSLFLSTLLNLYLHRVLLPFIPLLHFFPRRPLSPAVRVGDINAFNSALTTHSATFSADSTSSLILRLRHNVIKTALRTLSLAYSRISLSDISAKLALDSEEDAEYIVAKAIRDGVIDATVDHEKGYMQSRETGDVYATNEPQQAFDTRIKFLLELHNQSVKVRSFSFFLFFFSFCLYVSTLLLIVSYALASPPFTTK